MNEIQSHRFAMLRERMVDERYVSDYYGIQDLRGREDLCGDMDAYRRSVLRNAPPAPAGSFDRYVIEGFLQARGLLPKKWAASRLGLQVDMLDRVLDRRNDLPTPLRKVYVYYGHLVDESLGEDLIRTLPELRYRTFYDHESFCERLQHALATALKIPEAEMRMAKLWCATDAALGELGDYPRRYALHFDCLTCEPLSVAHQVWLDFKKPFSLGPDRCSKLFYVENEEALRPFVAGTREPEGLDRYREALQVREAG